MNTQYTPASAGTWVVYLDEERHPLPVISWLCLGTQAAPMLPLGCPNLETGQAVMLPDGTTVDLATGSPFEDVESWRHWTTDQEPYTVGQPLEKHLSTKPNTRATLVEKRATSVENRPAAALPVVSFSGKTYKNNSFWKIDGRFVMQLPGGEPAPDAPMAEKITRGDFFELRKGEFEEVAYQTLRAVQQPDLPLEDDEENDDIEGMI